MSDEEAHEFVADIARKEMPVGWVYVVGSKRFVHTETKQIVDKEMFSDMFQHQYKNNPASTFMRNESSVKVDQFQFAPGQDLIFNDGDQRCFNTWTPMPINPEKGNTDIFDKHLEYLFPDDEYRKIAMDFLAYNIQHQGAKIHWALLVQGVQGTGKSFLGHVMRQLLGMSNVVSPTNEQLHDVSSSWQKACSFVIVEELMMRGRIDIMNRLKPMITQPTTIVREFYRDPYEQPNRFNFLLLTNHKDAILLDEFDRRYCVLFSPAAPMAEHYYQTLWAWTENNFPAILHKFQQHDLSDFNPYGHAPKTVSKYELIEESRPPLAAWMLSCIQSNTYPFHADIVGAQHLLVTIPKTFKGVTPQMITKTLDSINCVRLHTVRLDHGQRVQLWAVRGYRVCQEMTQDEQKNEYMKSVDGVNEFTQDLNNPLVAAKPM